MHSFFINYDSFNKWLDKYYELSGWDKEGVPTKKTLRKVGLDYVWEELKKHGIVTEEMVITGLK